MGDKGVTATVGRAQLPILRQMQACSGIHPLPLPSYQPCVLACSRVPETPEPGGHWWDAEEGVEEHNLCVTPKPWGWGN